ncbi:hypothetical protein J7M00_02240 [bacterium]|nr:hypothetical protein [bacterium]
MDRYWKPALVAGIVGLIMGAIWRKPPTGNIETVREEQQEFPPGPPEQPQMQ